MGSSEGDRTPKPRRAKGTKRNLGKSPGGMDVGRRTESREGIRRHDRLRKVDRERLDSLTIIRADDRTPNAAIAAADLVIDVDGYVVKDRAGNAGRKATQHEIERAVVA